MMLTSLVVFVGIAGKHGDAVEHQLAPVLAKAHVAAKAIAAGELGALARHADNSREVVQQLHVDGVVGGALIESGGSLTLRVVIYDGNGNLKSLGETPLAGKTLSKDELDVIASNLGDEIGPLVAKESPAPKPAKAELADVAFESPKPAAPAPPKPAPPAPHAAAPVETAAADTDAVSLDDVASLNSGGATTGGDVEDPNASAVAATTTAVAPSGSGLHLHAAAGLGVETRSFSGPAGVTGYSSSPVGTARVEAGLAPTRDLALAAMAEHSLAMTSAVGAATAATSISRWELTAAYMLTHGAVQIAPLAGVGQRDFSIDSTAPQRSPDADYGYVVLGAALTIPLGQRLAAHGLAAFEPVFGGSAATDMAYGPATRWALDVGAGIDLRIFSHVVVRGALDYQRFAWSWSAGARGAGGATDSYPSATLAVGADY